MKYLMIGSYSMDENLQGKKKFFYSKRQRIYILSKINNAKYGGYVYLLRVDRVGIKE